MGAKILVPASAAPRPAVPGYVAAVLNQCWSEAKLGANPSTRALTLTVELLTRIHAMQALSRSSNRRRLQ